MSGALIGALRVTLGIDTAAFEQGLGIAQKRLSAAGKALQKVGDGMSDVGKTLSVAVTAPLAAAGVGVVKLAADFESSMNKVAISTQAPADQMKAMSDLALKLGASTTFSASQAADAMDMLAKNGLTATDIMGGAAKAALDLASATGSELDPAAASLTDTLQQFRMKISDLPSIVNQITGAVNQSKLDFADYQQAAAAAGGVAANVGVNFKDFSAVLAGISPLFASGSDAGTSFKTMLTAIGNPSKQAAAEIQRLGLEFYDATGKLKPMSDIAEQLRIKLSGLSDQAKTKSLATIFGSDAIRSALGLMQLGAKGLDDIKDKIAATDAAAQSAQRLKGFNGELEQLRGAIETLAISIGNSGLLSVLTSMVSGFAGFIDTLAQVSPAALNVGVGFAAIAAAVGPVLVVIGSITSAIGSILPVLAPVVTLIGEAGLAAALGAAATAAAPFVAAGALIWATWDKIGPVLEAFWQKLQAVLGPRLSALAQAVTALLTALWNGPFGSLIRGVIGIIGDLGAAVLSVFGEVLIRALSVAADYVTTAFKTIANVLNIVGALLRGDFSGAWQGVKTLVADVVNGWLAVLNDLAPGAAKAISALVTGVQEWIGRRLSAIWDAAKEKIQSLGDKFKWLWDVVVGHSYIPDLFDGIQNEASRFLPEFVTPLTAGIDTVAQAFEGLDFTMPPLDPSIPTPGEDQKKDGEPSSSAGNDMQETFRQTFSDGIRAALDGNLKGFFQNWFEGIGNRAFENILNSVADEFGKVLSGLFQSGGSSSGGGILGFLGSAVSNIFGRSPGFALGGSFTVGGRPGRDANLVAFRATRGEKVQITNGDVEGSAAASSSLQFNFYGPVTNPEQVRRSAAQAGAQLLRMSATGKRGV